MHKTLHQPYWKSLVSLQIAGPRSGLLLHHLHHWQPSRTCSLPRFSRSKCWPWWSKSCNSNNDLWPCSSNRKFQPFLLLSLAPTIDLPEKDPPTNGYLISYSFLHLNERIIGHPKGGPSIIKLSIDHSLPYCTKPIPRTRSDDREKSQSKSIRNLHPSHYRILWREIYWRGYSLTGQAMPRWVRSQVEWHQPSTCWSSRWKLCTDKFWHPSSSHLLDHGGTDS